MDKKRSIAIALGLVVGLSLSAFLLRPLFATPASTGPAGAAEHGEHAEEAGHAKETGETGEAEHAEEEGTLELSEAQIQAAGIEFAQAQPRSLSTLLALPGEVRFDEDRTSHIVPRAAGVVESVQVNLGQTVKRGELLAVIASQQVSDQRSELAAAQRRVELARTTFQRERQLWVEQIAAEQDYLQARQALQEAEIAQNNARQKMNALSGSALLVGGNRYEMRAPFDGVVVEKHLSVGEVVNESSVAFTLSDLSRVWVTFGVFPKDLDKVRVGKPVIVSSSELGTEVQGQVAYVGSLLGEQSRTATVRVSLANPQDAWRPGLFVAVQVATDTYQAPVTVPDTAIQTVEGQTSVFVRVEHGFITQTVVTGASQDGFVEIKKGLAAGALVATNGSFTLKSELGKGSAEHAH